MKTDANELNIAAEIDKLPEVLTFIDQLLEEHDCPPKAQMQIDIAVEELFVNIAHYAYPDGSGSVNIRADFSEEDVAITFTDSGIPYDPLKKPDPDITLAAEERQIGGLGIFMSKKLMDDITYAYEDDKNILTIKKSF